jgi:lysophospholipase L1-like esterase
MRPYRVFLFVLACLGVLAVLCVVLPHELVVGDRTLHWPTLADVFELPTDTCGTDELSDLAELEAAEELEEFPVAPDSLTVDTASLEPAKPATPKPVVPKVEINENWDSRIYLAAFYDALPETERHVVRVVHYGDSQIEEDRMSQQIREHLQGRYGGRGVGLMPLAQTIPTRTVRQELFMQGKRISPQQGPRRYLVYSFKRDQRADGMYGPMGQMVYMADSLVKGSEDITAVCTPLDKGPYYTRWQVFADDSIQYSFAGDTVHLSGKGGVYGLSQESSTGVIVDNVPMRGCLGNVFTRMNEGQLRRFYREQNVRLIIMQFGGNAIPSNRSPGTIAAIVSGLRDQVRYLKNCAPEAAILFIGPSDMLTQTDGEWATYPMVPYMDRLLQKMAAEEEIAYFSLYRWMGGSGSMLKWQEVGLAGSDGVHFTRAGARKAGNAVAEWILEGER